MLGSNGLQSNIETYVHDLSNGIDQRLTGTNIADFVEVMDDYDDVYQAREWLLAAAPHHRRDWHRKVTVLKDCLDFRLLYILKCDVAEAFGQNVIENWIDDGGNK